MMLHKLVWLVVSSLELVSASKAPFKLNGLREIKINIEEGLGSQDTAGVNEWSYALPPAMKRCDFRQLNIMCYDEVPTSSNICQVNCDFRGYQIGICFSEPGPGTQPSGEWAKPRGKSFCYCGNCQNDKCKDYCYNSGFATGYCHQSASFATRCKCVGCDVTICNKHCDSIFGQSLDHSTCENNECKCTAKNCDEYY